MKNVSSAENTELVFALSYGVGTDADAVVRVLEDYLKQFQYIPLTFRISDYLRSLDLGIEFDKSSSSDLAHAMMDAGDRARDITKADDILALGAINEIVDHRPKDEREERAPLFNHAHIIRSLKRPEEVALLRRVYRSGFFLIGIASDDDAQVSYLVKRRGLSENEARALIIRDEDERKIHGQRTRDTFYLADVFLDLRENRFEAQLERFLELIFGHPFLTPTRDEHAMFLACASAVRSAQLGRQVGAAIATAEGEVVAVGFNEVPSKKGGPYWEGDGGDSRDHKVGEDSNTEHRKKMVDSVLVAISNRLPDTKNIEDLVREAVAKLNNSKDVNETLVKALQDIFVKNGFFPSIAELKPLVESSDLNQITEFGRAVHAEMDTILTCARLGINSKEKILFTTTFPCHNCTRHIIASGIAKVVYIEPYPKSKAKDLHSDAICFDEVEAEKSGKIPFVPFVGIGPRRYLDLFSRQIITGLQVDRKGPDDKPLLWEKKSHKGPRVAMEPYNYLETEQKALDENKAKLRELTELRENR